MASERPALTPCPNDRDGSTSPPSPHTAASPPLEPPCCKAITQKPKALLPGAVEGTHHKNEGQTFQGAVPDPKSAPRNVGVGRPVTEAAFFFVKATPDRTRASKRGLHSAQCRLHQRHQHLVLRHHFCQLSSQGTVAGRLRRPLPDIPAVCGPKYRAVGSQHRCPTHICLPLTVKQKKSQELTFTKHLIWDWIFNHHSKTEATQQVEGSPGMNTDHQHQGWPSFHSVRLTASLLAENHT